MGITAHAMANILLFRAFVAFYSEDLNFELYCPVDFSFEVHSPF